MESFNGGVPGYTSRDTVAFFRNRVSRYEPDQTLIYHGWNDAKYFEPLAAGRSFEDVFPARPSLLARYAFLSAPSPRRNWRALELMWRELGASSEDLRESRATTEARRDQLARDDRVTRDWASTPGVEEFRRNLEEFVWLARRAGGRPVLMVQVTLATPTTPVADRLKRIRYDYIGVGHGDLIAINEVMANVVHAVGVAESVVVLDFREEMNGQAASFSDHVHLTQAGSERLARLVAHALSGEPAP